VAWGRHSSVITYVRDRRKKLLIQISVFYIDLDKQFIKKMPLKEQLIFDIYIFE
jgi:hypothetical protein